MPPSLGDGDGEPGQVGAAVPPLAEDGVRREEGRDAQLEAPPVPVPALLGRLQQAPLGRGEGGAAGLLGQDAVGLGGHVAVDPPLGHPAGDALVEGDGLAPGVQPVAVLDRVHAGLDGVGDALRAQAVGGHAAPQAVGVLDDGPQLGDGELGPPDVRAGGHAPPGGHHLDEVDPLLDQAPDEGAGPLRGVHLAPADPQVAGGAGDRRAADEQARAGEEAGGDAVPQGAQERPPAPAVAHRGHAGLQEARGVVGGADEQLMVVEGPGVVEDRLPAAVHQVHVAVDQAGEDGRLRVLQDGRAGREGHLRRRPGGDDRGRPAPGWPRPRWGRPRETPAGAPVIRVAQRR